MSSQKQEEQLKWFEQELAKARSTPFLAVVAHHPLYSNGMHGDNPTLIAQWDSLLRHHYVDLYLSGHDHDLQHIQLQGHPTFFVISGEGGADLVRWTTPPEARGPWARRALGFTDLQLSNDELVIRHIDKNGTAIYSGRAGLLLLKLYSSNRRVRNSD